MAVAALAGVLALALSISRGDQASRSGLQLTFRVEPAGAAAAQGAAQVMRARLSAAAIADARVAVASNASLTITAPASAHADVIALVQRGHVAIYDWERSVLGPRRVPAPADATVTGGAHAGWDAGITRTRARARAAGRLDGWVVRGGRAGPKRWFALGGDPALTDADIASAGAGTDPATGDPIVTIEFTARGQQAFTALTRTLAHRARARAARDLGDSEARQHFAIVIDDRLAAVPSIDFRAAPDGIDGATGAQIQGGLLPPEARRVAAILATGPLPAALSSSTGNRPHVKETAR